MIRTDGPLEVGGVLSSGETAPLQLDSSKNLKVTGTATVSGTVTANQGTAGVSAWLVTDSTVETNTTPLVTSGGGGYVRQDSTATIAKETGGNLATVASLASALGGTVAPSKTVVVEGKTNDGAPQYQPIPEGAGGRSVIIEGYAGGTAVPVSLASAPSTSVTQGTSPWVVSSSASLAAAPLPGQAKITVTGTAVQLGANMLTNGVIIAAKATNAADILIGGSAVTRTEDGTGNGFILQPGAMISFAVANTNALWINGTAGDLVSFAGS